nr:hypothetical protein [Candidatus Thiodictyon syntrophicum]
MTRYLFPAGICSDRISEMHPIRPPRPKGQSYPLKKGKTFRENQESLTQIAEKSFPRLIEINPQANKLMVPQRATASPRAQPGVSLLQHPLERPQHLRSTLFHVEQIEIEEAPSNRWLTFKKPPGTLPNQPHDEPPGKFSTITYHDALHVSRSHSPLAEIRQLPNRVLTPFPDIPHHPRHFLAQGRQVTTPSPSKTFAPRQQIHRFQHRCLPRPVGPNEKRAGTPDIHLSVLNIPEPVDPQQFHARANHRPICP